MIKPKRRSIDPTPQRGYTFFDLAYTFRDYGVGRVFVRTRVRKLKDRVVTTEIPYLITHVVPTFNVTLLRDKIFLGLILCFEKKNQGFGKRRGKAWGIKTYKGITEDVALRINCTNKREWSCPKMTTDQEIEL